VQYFLWYGILCTLLGRQLQRLTKLAAYLAFTIRLLLSHCNWPTFYALLFALFRSVMWEPKGH
jgi:hypothetical protein